MIRPETQPFNPSAMPAAEAEETIFYRWALTDEDRSSLEAEGWREIARHPVHGASVM